MTTVATTMRAVVQDSYGDAELLRCAEIPRPTPGPGEVLLRVAAAGLDRGVVHLMTGLPYPIRLAGYGVRRPKNPVRGREVAGQVVTVGDGVQDLRPGDEVFGIGEGCFAEFTLARADLLLRRPDTVDPVAAAALPISGLTALQAVRDHGCVERGQRVLVLGASGGVGTFVVQLAVAAGAEVTAVCRASKVDRVRALGATQVVDHTTTEPRGEFDVILDTGGNRPLRRLRRLLSPRGRLVIIGGETDGRLLGGTDRQLRAMAWSPFLRQRLGTFVASENGPDLAVLRDLAAAGTLRPVVDRTYQLDATPDAIRDMVAGRLTGKAVITVG